jgi:hypothetical protein
MTRASDRTSKPRGERPAARMQSSDPRQRRLALVTAGGFAAVVAFQLALVAGAPWGSAAWGGTTPGRLPTELRTASAFAGCFYLAAALTALARGGVAASAVPHTFSRRAMWALTAVLAVGTVLNAASPSRWERYGWAPFVMGLTILSLQLARSGRPHDLPRPATARASGRPRGGDTSAVHHEPGFPGGPSKGL